MNWSKFFLVASLVVASILIIYFVGDISYRVGYIEGYLGIKH